MLIDIQVPLVAPLVGALFGGFLYDVFIFEGQSPINRPWMGLRRRVIKPRRKDSLA